MIEGLPTATNISEVRSPTLPSTTGAITVIVFDALAFLSALATAVTTIGVSNLTVTPSLTVRTSSAICTKSLPFSETSQS